MFHRINESMVLGMHPAISCPRRSQSRPLRVSRLPRRSLGGGGHAPRRRVPTSLFNGVRPSTTRRGQGERHCLIKQRERTDYPQLTDVPSDLRVNGARHASHDSVPPSKPDSPPRVRSLSRRDARPCSRSYCTTLPRVVLPRVRYGKQFERESRTRQLSRSERTHDYRQLVLTDLIVVTG